ncbi:exported protein of unknown function [Legionella hackeliae]|uniref:Uncharacterized protein n=1 Tax=Legionella hackeliae TaxID=449 RepID=A0A0A8UW29_LEGHA|nr:exported protein of unknown function [Legionella hackeliae]
MKFFLLNYLPLVAIVVSSVILLAVYQKGSHRANTYFVVTYWPAFFWSGG